MDLDSSGLAGTLSDTMQLTSSSDLLLTPNASHSQFLNRNTSLLMERMHGTHMTPESSPMVSILAIVCTLISFFSSFQNALSSPLELQLGRISEEQLLASGNAVYLRSQLVLERQRRKITELENHIQMLETQVVIWKTRHTSTQYVLLLSTNSFLSHCH